MSLPRSGYMAIALVIPAAMLLAVVQGFYHDDAYIALRYARNLLQGEGLVWNPGEAVEGYTSLLWVVGCALLGLVGMDLETAGRLLGILSLPALGWLLIGREGVAGLWSCALLATIGPLIAWSVGGLETVGFAFLLTAALLAGEVLLTRPPGGGRAFWAGVLFGLAELCRPEATLYAAILVGCLTLSSSLPARWRVIAQFGAGFSALFVPRLIWRYATYGDLLPNTFYVKRGGGVSNLAYGAEYVAAFIASYPGLILLALLALRHGRARRSDRGEAYLFASLAATLVYIVWAGGDHMQWFRFVVPALPVSVLLAARRLAPRLSSERPGRGLLLGVLVVWWLNAASTVILAGTLGWAAEDPAARRGSRVGRYIAEAWPEDAVVALNTAGSTAYHSRRTCIDMLGLNDRRIARREMPPPPRDLPWANLPGHRKGDGAYVLSREPDFVIIGGSEGDTAPWFVGDREILEDPRFGESYRLREVMLDAEGSLPPARFRYFERVAASPGASR